MKLTNHVLTRVYAPYFSLAYQCFDLLCQLARTAAEIGDVLTPLRIQ